MNEHMNCTEMFTQEMINKARSNATKYAEKTHGALTADDLIQSAVLSLWRTRESIPVRDPRRALTARIRREYLVWVNGTNSRFGPRSKAHEVSPRQKYLSAVEYPGDEGSWALTEGNPVGKWELLLDVEQAVQTLTAKEQQLVKWRFEDDLSNEEIGVRLGVTRMTIKRWFDPILAKLKTQLAGYE